MKKFIWVLVLAAMMLPLSAMAQTTTTFSWDYSAEDSQYLTDNAGGFRMYASKTASGPYTLIGGDVAPTSLTTVVDTAALRGRWYFVVKAFIPGVESDPSNEVSAPFKPETPGNLRTAQVGEPIVIDFGNPEVTS